MTKPTAGSSLWRTSRPPGHHCNHSVDTGISASIGAAPPFCSGVCSCSRSWGIFAPTPRRRWRMGSDMSMSMYPFVGRWMYHIDKRYTTIGLGRYIYWGWSTGRGERDTQQSNNRRGYGLNYLSGGYNGDKTRMIRWMALQGHMRGKAAQCNNQLWYRMSASLSSLFVLHGGGNIAEIA